MKSKFILNIFNFILKKYKKLYMKITKTSNIYSINNDDSDNNINYKISPLDNLSMYNANKYTYLDTNNELLSNYDSMIINILKEILYINEKICLNIKISDKLKDSRIDLNLILKDKKFKVIFMILLYNYKYIKNNC